MPITDFANLKIIEQKIADIPSELNKSTLWRHARGRASRKDKAIKQQYLTPCEEKARGFRHQSDERETRFLHKEHPWPRCEQGDKYVRLPEKGNSGGDC